MKKFLIIALCLTLSFAFITNTYAQTPVEQARTAVDSVKNKDLTLGNQDKVANLTATIIQAVTVIGSILGVIMLIIFGIKWLVSGPTQKGKLKEEMWNYVWGIVFLFGAGPIAQLVYNLIVGTGTTP